MDTVPTENRIDQVAQHSRSRDLEGKLHMHWVCECVGREKPRFGLLLVLHSRSDFSKPNQSRVEKCYGRSSEITAVLADFDWIHHRWIAAGLEDVGQLNQPVLNHSFSALRRHCLRLVQHELHCGEYSDNAVGGSLQRGDVFFSARLLDT